MKVKKLKIASIISHDFSKDGNTQKFNHFLNKLKEVAIMGNSDVQYSLGKIYYSMNEIDECSKWINQSFLNRNPKAVVFIAMWNLNHKNFSKAIIHFDMAAKLGSAMALVHLGRLHKKGFINENGYIIINEQKAAQAYVQLMEQVPVLFNQILYNEKYKELDVLNFFHTKVLKNQDNRLMWEKFEKYIKLINL